MEFEGGGCIRMLLWYVFVVPFLFVIGLVTGDRDMGSPE